MFSVASEENVYPVFHYKVFLLGVFLYHSVLFIISVKGQIWKSVNTLEILLCNVGKVTCTQILCMPLYLCPFSLFHTHPHPFSQGTVIINDATPLSQLISGPNFKALSRRGLQPFLPPKVKDENLYILLYKITMITCTLRNTSQVFHVSFKYRELKQWSLRHTIKVKKRKMYASPTI